MPASTERIVVSHAGALPRPDALQRLFGAGPGFEDAIDAALPGAVAEVVDRQAAACVDIVNDGEISKQETSLLEILPVVDDVNANGCCFDHLRHRAGKRRVDGVLETRPAPKRRCRGSGRGDAGVGQRESVLGRPVGSSALQSSLPQLVIRGQVRHGGPTSLLPMSSSGSRRPAKSPEALRCDCSGLLNQYPYILAEGARWWDGSWIRRTWPWLRATLKGGRRRWLGRRRRSARLAAACILSGTWPLEAVDVTTHGVRPVPRGPRGSPPGTRDWPPIARRRHAVPAAACCAPRSSSACRIA